MAPVRLAVGALVMLAACSTASEEERLLRDYPWLKEEGAPWPYDEPPYLLRPLHDECSKAAEQLELPLGAAGLDKEFLEQLRKEAYETCLLTHRHRLAAGVGSDWLMTGLALSLGRAGDAGPPARAPARRWRMALGTKSRLRGLRTPLRHDNLRFLRIV